MQRLLGGTPLEKQSRVMLKRVTSFKDFSGTLHQPCVRLRVAADDEPDRLPWYGRDPTLVIRIEFEEAQLWVPLLDQAFLRRSEYVLPEAHRPHCFTDIAPMERGEARPRAPVACREGEAWRAPAGRASMRRALSFPFSSPQEPVEAGLKGARPTCLALPHDARAPAGTFKRASDLRVPRDVSGQLVSPEDGAGLGCWLAERTPVAVPKTTVHEDDLSSSWEYQIRRAGKIAHVQAIPEPE